MKAVLVVVLALVAAVCAKPASKKRLGGALTSAKVEETLEKVLADSSIDEIRQGAKKLNEDLTEAVHDVGDMIALGGILDENFKLKPEAERLSNKFMSKFMDVEIDLEKLPALPEDESKWVILPMCIEEAKKVDFNAIADPVDFMNAVFHQVLSCAGSGLAVMANIVDISDLDDSELTVEELGSRLMMLEKVAHELAHLAKFTIGFIKRVQEKGFDGDKNDLVWDNDGNGEHGPTPTGMGPNDDHKGPRPTRKGPKYDKRERKGPKPTGDPEHNDGEEDKSKEPNKSMVDDDDVDDSKEPKPTGQGPGHDDDDDDDDDDDSTKPKPTGKSPNDDEDEEERLLRRLLMVLRKKGGSHSGVDDDDDDDDDDGPQPTGKGPKHYDDDDDDDIDKRKRKPHGFKSNDRKGPRPTGPKPDDGHSKGPRPTGKGPRPTGKGPKSYEHDDDDDDNGSRPTTDGYDPDFIAYVLKEAGRRSLKN